MEKLTINDEMPSHEARGIGSGPRPEPQAAGAAEAKTGDQEP